MIIDNNCCGDKRKKWRAIKCEIVAETYYFGISDGVWKSNHKYKN